MASGCSAPSLKKKKGEVVTPTKIITSDKTKRDPSRSSQEPVWIELEPVVNTVGEIQTYSFQSDAGHFEYSLQSSFRWVCKEKVSFTYRFCSWEEHRHRPSCADYMPAGPLMDITVTAGKLEEVQLPHWIDYNPQMSDMFAVLHVENCGDFVEKVSEVTSSHVKLLQPTFSPIGVMFRQLLGFPVSVFYDVLMYKTVKAFLTLDVYLVPPDPALQKEVEKTQNGSRVILKPGPDKSMQVGGIFSLTADKADAEIQPSTRELRYDIRNIFEVFIENADSDFTLKLESEQNTVWTCTIRKGDYQSQSSDPKQGRHFVDQHRTALINRVSDTGFILDELLDKGLISDEIYEAIRVIPTTHDQMRRILRSVTSAGTEGKDAFYKILKRMRSMKALIRELEGSSV
ncbi:NACHT, LRR and PYD domains-containing protein 1a allele 5-like [Centropristis striata]|uniref:NACHT, LRR and PYD domains-containing protein 1a allele 5-like n=1 Tax=Centropristis striata TaxID=184440 RepID=UPI0027E1A1E5|nr:NACHT, LRR and PYD domains-containing protein 1a allele 5-like [Centropristis striata]